MMEQQKKLDLVTIQQRLTNARGRQYWRSLDELAETDEFKKLLNTEFPRQSADWKDDEGRREFLKLMGASLALAGLSACTRQPTEQIVPYLRQPEQIIPGKPLFFATAMPLAGDATGLLVESHMGRPIKAEGNPEHPASLGACDVFAQGSVLTLYDPDRSQALTYEGEIRSWAAFLGALRESLDQQRGKQGAGLRILTETIASPTLSDQINGILKDFPSAKWYQWEPAGAHSVRKGAEMAFGQPVNTYYNLLNADVIVSLDADFLSSLPGSNLRYSREFAERRRVSGQSTQMNRLYVVEPMPTPTGSKADHRMPLRASEVEAFAIALASALGVNIAGAPQVQDPRFDRWIGPLVRDLQSHRGRCVIMPGKHQPPTVHALAHAMNQTLGNVGSTVFHTTPLETNSVDQVGSLWELVKDLDAGAVDLLLIIGANPVFTAPVDMAFGSRIKKARVRIHLGLYADETSAACQWHLPQTHYLETWSDTRAYDGTVTIMQPLIAPLYRGRSAHEVLTMLTANPELSSYEIVRGYWRKQHGGGTDFEDWWRKVVHDGVVPNTALPRTNISVKFGWSGATRKHEGLEIIFRPDPCIFDGQFANNGWLQELPKPITKLVWDNAAIISPGTAHRLGVESSDLVNLRYRGYTVRAPIFVQPGHADGAVTVYLGYGRTRAGGVGTRVGFSAYGLRYSDALWQDYGLEVQKTGQDYILASTQNHHVLDTRRHIIAKADIDEYRKDPNIIHAEVEAPPPNLTIYPQYEYDKYAWGMAIDLNVCTGCQACVIACQSENNIPVVGKTECYRQREMHWLRVDSYYHGSLSDPEIYNQPVPCMQCEDAPCELVCPVHATVHSSEGLNDMVYNRCVGTRYCSNNCPWKVRRFNFFLFSDYHTESLKLRNNPDVTVRSRGVMEKCTYCVQRINAAKIEAEKENRSVRDGEIQTACQAACPTEAIVFGNINDRTSRVSKMKAEPLNYALLGELNTRPRTTYLATLSNPNPEIES